MSHENPSLTVPSTITAPEIAKALGISIAQVKMRVIADPTFPPAVRFSQRPKRWISADVQRWVNKQISDQAA